MKSLLAFTALLALAAGPAVADPKTICNDGTVTRSLGRGACSRHGGIARITEERPSHGQRGPVRPRTYDRSATRRRAEPVWPPADRRTKAPPPVTQEALNATARCRDGSVSHSEHRSGTCAFHGGVDTWFER